MATALGALGVLAATVACTTPPPGQDLTVGVSGGNIGPVGFSSVTWKAVGSDAVTGPTTVTLTVLSGPLQVSDAQFLDMDPNYKVTGYVMAEDRRTMTLTFDGTTAPDQGRFFKFKFGISGPAVEGATGKLRATIANANDTNPANDLAETDYTITVGPFPTTTIAG